jgi:hypothetical protein
VEGNRGSTVENRLALQRSLFILIVHNFLRVYAPCSQGRKFAPFGVKIGTRGQVDRLILTPTAVGNGPFRYALPTDNRILTPRVTCWNDRLPASNKQTDLHDHSCACLRAYEFVGEIQQRSVRYQRAITILIVMGAQNCGITPNLP